LAGFDKHMNLILRDAQEAYTVLLRVCRTLPARPLAPGGATADAAAAAACRATAAAGGGGGADSQPVADEAALPEGGASTAAAPAAEGGAGRERMRWGRKQEVRRRTLKQVFVRGDNVVMVSLVEGAGQAAQAAAQLSSAA